MSIFVQPHVIFLLDPPSRCLKTRRLLIVQETLRTPPPRDNYDHTPIHVREQRYVYAFIYLLLLQVH